MILNLIFNTLFLQDPTLESDFVFFIILLIILYFVLLLMRLTKVLKKKMCPSCRGKLNRKRRTPFDKLLVILTFGILPLRRYKCVHCGWEGLRWNETKHRLKDAY